MATPRSSTLVPDNGSSTTASAKKKTTAKKSSSARAQTPAKPVIVRTGGPIEILFTQEPTPHRHPEPPFIWIDYPTQAETLNTPTYTIRLGVGDADLVEISLDSGAWLPCRLTSGYWWYDWSAIVPGAHALVARMRTGDGRWFKTPIRQCVYRPE